MSNNNPCVMRFDKSTPVRDLTNTHLGFLKNYLIRLLYKYTNANVYIDLSS